MNFSDFSDRVDKHKNGTYVCVDLIDSDAKLLHDWVVANLDLPNPVPQKDYHTTITYSRTPVPDVEDYEFKFPITGTITGWMVLGQDGNRFLVAHVESEQLHRINGDITREYGATSDFPTYIPHITISYDFDGEIPQNYPAMQITYGSHKIDGLKPSWRPTE